MKVSPPVVKVRPIHFCPVFATMADSAKKSNFREKKDSRELLMEIIKRKF